MPNLVPWCGIRSGVVGVFELFRSKVFIQEEHVLVTHGPYRKTWALIPFIW